MLGQTDTKLDLLLERLGNYEEKFPQEKVYLHLDRSYYSPGDNVWFKSYVTSGNYNFLSSLSQLIDVELINSENEVIQGIRLPLSAGISFGDFKLDSTLTNGDYRVRAYTQWMRNFQKSYFFEKTIHVINPLEEADLESNKISKQIKSSKETKTKKGTTPNQDLSLSKDLWKISVYPEGGHLSLGAANKIVIHVKNNFGEPVSSKGWLLSKNEERVMEIQTFANGLGEFIFIPEVNNSYSVLLNDENGHSQSLSIPPPKNNYGLSINRFTNDFLRIQVRLDTNVKVDQELNLLVQQNGQVFYAVKLKASKSDALLSIPTEVLGDGVSEITLFSAEMQPLAYRNFFYINPSRRLPVELKMDKQSYSTREKVIVTVHSGFETDTFRVASLSAAVTHDEKVPYDDSDADNILSYLLLKPSLNEETQVPWTAILKSNKDKTKEVDDLMLTVGRNGVWDKLDKMEIEYPVEKSMQISGWVTKLNEKKPVPFAKVILLSAQHSLFLDTIADENGRFRFDRLFFDDEAKFVVQARGEKGQKHLVIHLDSLQNHDAIQKKNSLEISSGPKEAEEQYKKSNTDRLQEMMRAGNLEKGIILSDVEVKVQKKSHSSNLNGPGNADQILEAKDLETCPSLIMCLQGRLTGVVFQGGVPYSTRSMGTPMGLIVDGMQMEGSEIEFVNPSDIETIEVLRNGHYLTMYGSFGSGGLIIITTKRGDGGRPISNYTPGLVTYSPKGFSPMREFISPDYTSSTQKYIANDLRSTIYWKPNLVSDKDGETSFEFHTSDQPGKYRIIVQGIDIEGKLGYSMLEFDVK